MSACKFIASDSPLPLYSPNKEYTLEINIDEGIIYDGGDDSAYSLIEFSDVSLYTDKKYGVVLEWDYTEGRANEIIKYIKNALKETENIEFWNVWLTEYFEFEDRPFIQRKEISVDELTVLHIKEINEAKNWNSPDKNYPERPSFYCLKIKR